MIQTSLSHIVQKKIIVTLFCCLFLIAGFSFAAPVEKTGVREHEGVTGQIKVTASEKEISISDSINLNVEVTVPKGFTIRFPDFSEFGFSTGLNERSQRFRATNVTEVNKTELKDGSTLFYQEFTLEPWLSGNYSILPLIVPFYKQEKELAESKPESGPELEKGKKNKQWDIPAFNVMTDGFRIKVNPLTDIRKELSDLYGQSDYKQETLTKRIRRKEDKSDEELLREQEQEKETAMALQERRFPWWIIWTLLFIALAFGLIKFVGKEKISALFPSKRKPAHEIAYKAFDELMRKDLLSKGKIKEFYYELSYILREYIGNRFGIFAINQTTEEFFYTLLQSNPFDKDAEETLRVFSDHADTVKYSLYRPDTKKADDSYKTAKSFVDKTKETNEEAN